MTNCKNCGAVLTNGRYCSYCGSDTGRTEHIEIRTPIVQVPTKTINAQIPVPIEAQDESMVRKYLLSKICQKIHEDIDSMNLQKNELNLNPMDNTITYETKFSYAFL